MVIDEKMKVNKFRDVRIPSGQELWDRFKNASLPDMYAGDQESNPNGSTKTAQLQEYMEGTYAEIENNKD